jgi:hypothetical protein
VDNTDPTNPVIAFPAPADIGAATSAQGALADSALQSIVAGTNITVDVTDPENPIINSSGGSVAPATTAENDFQIGNGFGVWIKKTLAEISTILRTSLDGVYTKLSSMSAANAALLVGGGSTVLHTHAMANHKAQHQLGGADEIDVSPLVAIRPAMIIASTGNSSYWTPQLTAGRGITSVGFSSIYAGTGNTINDIVGNSVGDTINIAVSGGPRTIIRIRLASWTTSNKSEMWAGLFASTSAFPTTTGAHIGFRLLETAGAGASKATLYTSCGTGAGGTQTAIATNVGTIYSPLEVAFDFSSTGILYYLNGSLVATHTTNYAMNTNLHFGIWAKTFEAVSKAVFIYSPIIMQG